MEIWKTELDTLTPKNIEEYIRKYQSEVVPQMDDMWNYYLGKNVTILKRKEGDPNNPDNRTPVPYGRKIVTTFTGYAYRPGYTTYKAGDEIDEKYMVQLQDTFDLSREHIKTTHAGRDTAIFGVAYEMVYISGVVDEELNDKAETRFFSLDPREVILLYDYSPEPKKKIGIRFYKINDDYYKVEVYYDITVVLYDRKKSVGGTNAGEWVLTEDKTLNNFFEEPPIVPYYFGDALQGIIEPIVPLIDDYDVIISDSINEFEKFAQAYLLLVKMGIVPPDLKKEQNAFSQALQNLKRSRVFENLQEPGAVSFLTKDIPKDFIDWMTETLKTQIHVQSHVPDFANVNMGEMSGAAIERLLFDFENVVSAAEAAFDEGLFERIRLINVIYEKSGIVDVNEESVVIMHKRNMPLNLEDFAETALKMSQAGFSRYVIADIMPDDIIPNVDEELERQEEDAKSVLPDVDLYGDNPTPFEDVS